MKQAGSICRQARRVSLGMQRCMYASCAAKHDGNSNAGTAMLLATIKSTGSGMHAVEVVHISRGSGARL